MAQSSELEIVAQLRQTEDTAEVLSKLRDVKNEIIGHLRKKEDYVRAGILEVLSASLKMPSNEEVRLHALQLVSSFAQGGAAFLAPLASSGVIDAIFANITPKTPRPLLHVALGALLNCADAAAAAKPTSNIDAAWLADQMLESQQRQGSTLDTFATILLSHEAQRVTVRHIHHVARIIIKTCRQERHQFALAESHTLHALATNLASIVVKMGYLVPGAETWGQADGLANHIPPAAPTDANLAVVLGAISSIIGESPYVAYKFLHCPAILAVFPNLQYDPGSQVRAPFKSLHLAGLGETQSQRGAMDYMLPSIPVLPQKCGLTQASAFPHLGPRPNPFWGNGTVSEKNTATSKAPSSWPASRPDSGSAEDVDAEDTESQVVPWLIHLVRVRQAREKVAAAALLASLCRAGFVGRQREPAIGNLVIPPLLTLLSIIQDSTTTSDADVAENQELLERIPFVLSRLVTDSETLQKAACDADAVKLLSKLLKGSYDPLPDVSTMQPWSPNPEAPKLDNGLSPSRWLGERGQFPQLLHRTEIRESVLKCISALASMQEEYRKAFVDQELLQFIVESLSHVPEKPVVQKDRGQHDDCIKYLEDASENSTYGINPTSVLVAACHVIRTLSRSVSIVRTSLLDNGAVLPLFRLLRHRYIEIKTAATGAMCNLVTEVAPMRPQLIEYGIMGILCDHAHSLNASLRLNALWALKHFVHSIPNNLKKACFDQLGSGWLVQLVDADPSEQRPSEDLDEVMEDSSADQWRPQLAVPESPGLDPHLSNRIECRLEALHEAETNRSRRARADELAIQEQGLDFIRNLIGGGDSSTATANDVQDTTAMIEFLFQEIGSSDRLFEILKSKLRVKVVNGFANRRRPVGADGMENQRRLLYPQPRIVYCTVMILVHIAAGVPKYRQLIISQTDLLKELLPQLNLKDKEVRMSICHLVSNLTWQDDMLDAQDARQRVVELKRLGFHARLETLEAQDAELEVRERAKAALAQMTSSLHF